MGYPITVKIAGPAGQGIKSSGLLLSQILLAHGLNVADYSEYPSLIRGGHNTYQVSFSPNKVFAALRTVDLFYALESNHFQPHQPEFHPRTLIFAPDAKLNLPDYKNTTCLGSLAAILGLNPQTCLNLIKKQYPNFIDQNTQAFNLGFTYSQKNFSPLKIKLPSQKLTGHQIYDGNQAFAQGFLKAKGNFYAAYPMTPSTGALHSLAAQARPSVNVVHPEDEIAAASMAAGAAYAGARAAVGTSGGGFALMNETVSFAGMAEIGLVFYLVSRPGPATGLPTWTSQADLLYAIRSGHGEFPKVVLAAAHQQDSFDLAVASLNLAAQLQTPILLLSDKQIGESSTNLKLPRQVSLQPAKVNRQPGSNFQRYSWNSKTGISPITYPGTPGGQYLANSYEHDQFGYATEDADIAQKSLQKRLKKLQTAINLCPPAFCFGSGPHLILSWGSTFGAIRQVVSSTRYTHLHLRTLWPISPDLKNLLSKYKKITVIENNQTGQLTQLLKSQFDFNPHRQILKFDGRPFFAEEIHDQLK